METQWGLTPSDYQWAVAAFLAWEAGDQEAAVEVLRQTADRSLEFVFALLDVHCQTMKAAYTDLGAREVLQKWALALASTDPGEPK